LVNQYAWALQQGDSAGAAEATTRLWTDGPRRTPGQVNAQARARIRDMTTQQLQRHGDFLAHEEHMMPLAPPAIKRLSEVRVPTLIVVGEEDVPAVIEAASILEQGIPGAKKGGSSRDGSPPADGEAGGVQPRRAGLLKRVAGLARTVLCEHERDATPGGKSGAGGGARGNVCQPAARQKWLMDFWEVWRVCSRNASKPAIDSVIVNDSHIALARKQDIHDRTHSF